MKRFNFSLNHFDFGMVEAFLRLFVQQFLPLNLQAHMFSGKEKYTLLNWQVLMHLCVQTWQWEYTTNGGENLLFFVVQAGKEEPPYLVIGTDVSAKYKGAFCEAKVKKVVKVVKLKVSL